MKTSEIIVFIVYLLCMLGIGIFFFVKNRNGGEKTYILGGREMGPWVAALSAGASDMSAWVLMGLPTSIYALGLGQVWIPVGLAIGYTISWLLEAPRLRKFSIVANDSITIPQYLTNRFLSKSLALQVICAIVFLVAYTIYAASSVKACGTLFHTVIGMDPQIAMYLAAVVIVGYTFLGGFSAVCWTDFFQGMLVLGSMFIAPIFAAFMLDTSSMSSLPGGYLNPFSSWQDIVSGLAWGLGYFGMPHILVRFMAIEDEKKLVLSRRIASVWVVIAMTAGVLIGIVGLGMTKAGALETLTGSNSETIIVRIAGIISQHNALTALIAGIILAGILAATMSTADSQMLAAASGVSQNIVHDFLKIKISEKTNLLIARLTIVGIAIVSIFLARNPNSSVFKIVSFAWAGFGGAFGAVVLCSLFWKRCNLAGAIAGIISGGATVFIWKYLIRPLGGILDIYELLPAFIVSLIFIIVVSLLTKAPDEEIVREFEAASQKA